MHLIGPVRKRGIGAAVVAMSITLLMAGCKDSQPSASPPAPPVSRVTGAGNSTGARITFVCASGPSFGLCAVDGDGAGRVTLVTGSTGAVGGGELSPDGRRLVYFGGPNADSHIWLAAGNGSNPVDRGSGGGPSWSPDGGRLVYTQQAGARGGVSVMNADGTGVRPVSAFGRSGRWSPDGRLILFVVDPGGPNPAGVYTVPQQGGTATMVIPGGTDAAWSPDGTQIAFTARPDPTRPNTPSGTSIANADGSGQRRLDTPSQSFDSSPSWAPDGATILVERGALQGLDQRFVALQASGPPGERVVLAFVPPDNGSSPRWGDGLGQAGSLLAGRGLDVHGGFGVPLVAVPVADFAALNPQVSSASYSATVDWGDYSAKSEATVALSGDPLKAEGTVRADHTYLTTGTYTVVTTLHRSGGALSDQSFTSHASIAWGALVAAQPLSIPASIPLKGLLAVLTYPSSLGPPPPGAKAFTNWNDNWKNSPYNTWQQLKTLEIGPSGGVISVGVYEPNGYPYSEAGDYAPLLTLPGWGVRSTPGTAPLTVPLSVQVHNASTFRMDPPSASPLGSPVLFYPELDAIPGGWGSAEFDWEFPGRGRGSTNTTFADTPAMQKQFQTLLHLVKASGNNLDDKSVGRAMKPFGIEPATFDLWKDNFPRHILVHVFTDAAVPHDVTLTVKLTDQSTGTVVSLNPVPHTIQLVDGRTCLPLNYLLPLAPEVSFALVGNHTTCDLIAALKAIVHGPTRSPDYISADVSGGSDALVAGLTLTVTQSGKVFVSYHRGLGTPGFSASVIYGYFGLPNDPPPDVWKVDKLVNGWTYTAGVVGSTVVGDVSLGGTVVLGTTGFGWNAFEYAIVGGDPAASGQASCAVELGSDNDPPLRWLKYLQPTRTEPFPGRSSQPAVPTPTATQATDLLGRSLTLLNNAATCNSGPPPPS